MVRNLHVLILVLATFTLFTQQQVVADVDANWLKSWNEANAERPAELFAVSRIGTEAEPGKPLLVRGTIVTPGGEVASGVVVHAYQRDAAGYELGEKDREFTTWDLQGWAISDEQGQFQFHTIWPGIDHVIREPAHIHFTLESKRFGRQWAPKLYLKEALSSSTDADKPVQKVVLREIVITLKEQADF